MVDKNELKERLKSQAGNIISMVGFQMKDIKRKPRRKEHAQRLADLAAALHSAAETLISVEKLEAIEAAKKAEAERFERFSKMVENAAHEKKKARTRTMGMIRKIKRNKARANMREAGLVHIHKKIRPDFSILGLPGRGSSFFADHWRDYINV